MTTPTVCIATPNKHIYSESFVRAHIERLPFPSVVAWGSVPYTVVAPSDTPVFRKWTRRLEMRARSRPSLRRITQRRLDRDLSRFLRKSRPDVVLAEYGLMGADLTLACERNDVPLVVHFHGYDAHERTTLANYESAYKRMFACAAAFVVVSEPMRASLLALGAPKDRIVLAHYGVDLDQFHSRDRLETTPPTFVAAGRFVDKKAPHLTILAFARVLKTCDDARLVMYGNGPLAGACQELVKALGIEGQVDFPGVASPVELAEAMRSARAFVQHSVEAPNGDMEGLPFSILEASACGAAIVSTRHAGIPEAVEDGTAGFLVDEYDIESMAERMIRLARDPRLAHELGERGRARMEAEFDVTTYIERLSAVLVAAADHTPVTRSTANVKPTLDEPTPDQ